MSSAVGLSREPVVARSRRTFTRDPRRERRSRLSYGERGSAMIEVAVLCVLLALVMKLVTAVNRVNSGRSAVEQAAWAAARAASLDATPAQAQRDAEQTATTTLAKAGPSCVDPQVAMDASAFYPGGQVTVTVTCHTDLATLTVAGMPGWVHLSARGTAPLEVHRDLPQPVGGVA